MSNDDLEITQSGDQADPQSAESQTETLSVYADQLDTLIGYQELQIGIQCMIFGLILVAVIALSWVRHL